MSKIGICKKKFKEKIALHRRKIRSISPAGNKSSAKGYASVQEKKPLSRTLLEKFNVSRKPKGNPALSPLPECCHGQSLLSPQKPYQNHLLKIRKLLKYYISGKTAHYVAQNDSPGVQHTSLHCSSLPANCSLSLEVRVIPLT